MDKDKSGRRPPGPSKRFFLIPDYILWHPALTFTDMLVFWKISCYDKTDRHTFASNEWIGDELGLHPDNVKKSITKLAKQDIVDIYSQGKTRDLRIHEGLEKELWWVTDKYYREVEDKHLSRKVARKEARGKTKIKGGVKSPPLKRG